MTQLHGLKAEIEGPQPAPGYSMDFQYILRHRLVQLY